MRNPLPLVLCLLSGCAADPRSSDPPEADAAAARDSTPPAGDAARDSTLPAADAAPDSTPTASDAAPDSAPAVDIGAGGADGTPDGAPDATPEADAADPGPGCPGPDPRTIFACLGPAEPPAEGPPDCLHGDRRYCEQAVVGEVLEFGTGAAPGECQPAPGQPAFEGFWLRLRAADGRAWVFGWQFQNIPAWQNLAGEVMEVSWQLDYEQEQDAPSFGTELLLRHEGATLQYVNTGRGRGRPGLEPPEVTLTLAEELCRGQEDGETCTRVDRRLELSAPGERFTISPGTTGVIARLAVNLEELMFMESGGGCDAGPVRRLSVARQ